MKIVYKCIDGKIFEDKTKARKYESGFKYDCPNCLTKGTVDGEPVFVTVEDIDRMNYYRSMTILYKQEIAYYKQIICKYCNKFYKKKKIKKYDKIYNI